MAFEAIPIASFTTKTKKNTGITRSQGWDETWLIEHETYLEWKDGGTCSTLWCSGIPAAGKTFMASYVIDSLPSREVDLKVVTYIYADYKDRHQQNSLGFLSFITRQFASQSRLVLDLALLRDKEHALRSMTNEVPCLSFSDHLELFKESCMKVPNRFTIIDAVDEIAEFDNHGHDVRSELLEALTILIPSQGYYGPLNHTSEQTRTSMATMKPPSMPLILT
ncbi:hypothetical protein BCR34DRAFT_598136 [Clohesyomyces aquaticus]|uniref:Nephrocystin 3-like N-terminal domain-containing protein n=1 Tax=Clohesyomyces aquaticus TaxID=1231657 RepID=A0A1Y2A082_9PLEO|nr:hypothetical protein BCR34DRAFT_598136 [Clohesyomyces aquaticus]